MGFHGGATMSDLRTAAQQALDALESLYLPGELKRVNAAITALKAALEQPEQEPVAKSTWQKLYEAAIDQRNEAVAEVKRLLAQQEQEQEPGAFDHSVGYDRYQVVRGSYWWHIRIGDGTANVGKFHSKSAAEGMVQALMREFRNGAFVQHSIHPPRRETEQEPVAWMDKDGAVYKSPRLNFLGLIDETCGSREHIWSGTSLEEAGEAWKRFVAQGSKDVRLTGWNSGMIAMHREMESQFGEAKGTFACPICGQDTPHQHSTEDVNFHHENQRRWQEEEAKRWKAIQDRVAVLEARYPVRIPLYTHPPRREWVSLTEEERADILFPLTAAGASDMERARAIEAKLKEKNHE